MPRTVLACPFGDCRKTTADRHEHPYKPPPIGQQQCSCGSRHWSVTLGGSLPVSVHCDRCHKQSRISTAYERGREAGPRRRSDAPDQPPF